jgi:hypothetical protein
MAMADEIILRTDLSNLARGAVVEQFTAELKRVMANIEDERTDAEARREIAIVVKFKPHETRLAVAVSAAFKTKLAPPKDLEATIFVAHDTSGSPVALNNNPHQPDLFKN